MVWQRKSIVCGKHPSVHIHRLHNVLHGNLLQGLSATPPPQLNDVLVRIAVQVYDTTTLLLTEVNLGLYSQHPLKRRPSGSVS
jgi:hypothetical protein